MKTRALLTFIILFSLFFSACRKEFGKASWDVQALAPLIDATFSIDNLLPDSILHENKDSTLEIVYKKSISNFNIGNLFEIPDTTLKPAPYALPFSFVLNPGQVLPFPSTSETVYQLGGVELKKCIVKSGKVTFTVKSKVREETNFVYSIPCATLNGTPFSVNIVVPARVGNTAGTFSKSYDLSGYSFDLTGLTKNKVNAIYTSLKVSISSSAVDTVNVTPQDDVTIVNTFSDIIPYYAKGYLGQSTIVVPTTTTAFNFFDRINQGGLKLEKLKFNLSLENYIGVDARATITSLKSINTASNKTVSLIVSNPSISVNRAFENNSVITPTLSNFPLTSTNSNIKELIENLPDKLQYQMKVNINPLGNVSGSNDFIYTDKLLNAFFELNIPLSLITNNLTVGNILDFNISSGDNRHINNGTLTLFANNGFPLDAKIQLYTLDGNNAITDSLITSNNTILQAPLNSQLKVTSKRLTKIAIPLDVSKTTLLYKTKKVLFKVRFNTASQPNYVKIYSDYSIDIKLVGDFNYTVQLQ